MLSLLSNKTSSFLPSIKLSSNTGESSGDEGFGGADTEDDEEDTDDEMDEVDRPIHHEYWIRSLDAQKNVYHYNSRTAESSWLGPCYSCHKTAAKFCVDCDRAYCDKDFIRRHKKETRHRHKWQLTDNAVPLDLGKLDSYCIECNLNPGDTMCMNCWDTYCSHCFKKVHFIGALKHHKQLHVKEAKKGWICVKATSTKDQDYYLHGPTGETALRKPWDLMTEAERRLDAEFKRQETRLADTVKVVERIQYDIEKLKFERDRTIDESLTQLKDMHQKHLEKDKPVQGNILDASKIKSGGGMFSGLFGVNMEEIVYKEKLLNPNDRRRGENRTDYIATVVEMASHATARAAMDDNKGSKKKKG